MKQETMALFDMPYQWVFPVIFIVMTGIIGYCFLRYVILGSNDKEESTEADARAATAARESSEVTDATSESNSSTNSSDQK